MSGRRLQPLHLFAGRVAGFWAFGLGGLAAMILSGMGPSAEMPDDAAKVFASFYALCAGLAWTALLSVVPDPFVHRMLHALHLRMREGDET